MKVSDRTPPALPCSKPFRGARLAPDESSCPAPSSPCEGTSRPPCLPSRPPDSFSAVLWLCRHSSCQGSCKCWPLSGMFLSQEASRSHLSSDVPSARLPGLCGLKLQALLQPLLVACILSASWADAAAPGSCSAPHSVTCHLSPPFCRQNATFSEVTLWPVLLMTNFKFLENSLQHSINKTNHTSFPTYSNVGKCESGFRQIPPLLHVL